MKIDIIMWCNSVFCCDTLTCMLAWVGTLVSVVALGIALNIKINVKRTMKNREVCRYVSKAFAERYLSYSKNELKNKFSSNCNIVFISETEVNILNYKWFLPNTGQSGEEEILTSDFVKRHNKNETIEFKEGDLILVQDGDKCMLYEVIGIDTTKEYAVFMVEIVEVKK